MSEHFLPLGNYSVMPFLLPVVNWLQFSIQRDDECEASITTIYHFETSGSKRLSIEKYDSTKLQKPIYGTSRVQPLVEYFSLQMPMLPVVLLNVPRSARNPTVLYVYC